MKNRMIWLPILISLALGVTGCGDDDTGNGGGTGNSAGGGAGGASGTNGTGGSAGGGMPSDDVCSFVCNNRCVGDVGGLPNNSIPDCIDACRQTGIYDDCEAEVRAFLGCVDANDCGGAGAAECVDEALDFNEACLSF